MAEAEKYWYKCEERYAMPGSADGWPSVIEPPHTKHGRLVRVIGQPDQELKSLRAENIELHETLQRKIKVEKLCVRLEDAVVSENTLLRTKHKAEIAGIHSVIAGAIASGSFDRLKEMLA